MKASIFKLLDNFNRFVDSSNYGFIETDNLNLFYPPVFGKDFPLDSVQQFLYCYCTPEEESTIAEYGNNRVSYRLCVDGQIILLWRL